MNDVRFETAWPHPQDGLQHHAVEFWLKESALSEGKAIERAGQLVVACRVDRELAAVSTAVASRIDRLGLRCFYFRTFVGRDHRVRGLRSSKLIYSLIRKSYDVLNDRFQQNHDSDVVGLYLEVENPSVHRHRRELIWTDDGANIVFVGFLPNGRQARVWYFDGSTIPG